MGGSFSYKNIFVDDILAETTCQDQDTDNDGTPDHLDTDADGDGCYDAKEAGFTDANEDGQVDGTGIDADGLVTGGDGYTAPADTDSSGIADFLESGVATCNPSIDTDGDGVPDETDLDDDNDGILDTNDGLNCGTSTTENVKFSVDSSTLPSKFSPLPHTVSGTYLDQNDNVLGTWNFVLSPSNTAGQNQAKFDDFNVDNGVTIVDSGERIAFNLTAAYPHEIVGEFSFSGTEIIPVFNGASNAICTKNCAPSGIPLEYDIAWDNWNFSWAGGNAVTLSDPDNEITKSTGSYNSPLDFDINAVITNTNTDWNITFEGVTSFSFSANNGGTLEGFGLSAVIGTCTTTDTDGDGTPDHLDTDSDGDGCSDAVEAGFTDADEDGMVDGTGIDANGLVTGGDGYTTPADTDSSGTADHLEAGVAECNPDTDGDGTR